jgi:large subunit ribosomal protein L24e
MRQDSTIEFEKRRNVPVRYDRELVQTTVKAMKRVGEIRARRERAFFKHRYRWLFPQWFSLPHLFSRMAAAREKQKAHRKKVLDAAKSSVKLHEPISAESSKSKEKILVSVKFNSALIQGEGRSMGMEID